MSLFFFIYTIYIYNILVKMDKKIKLTESNLHDIVKETVQRILTESCQKQGIINIH